MTLAQIEYFLTVAELSNVSKAAERLYMTQPALSRQIAAMEEELGLQLFIRKSRPIKLTPAGEELYQGWMHLHQEYEGALKKAQAKASGIEGSLAIGVVSGLEIEDFLPGILAELREKYPMLDITVDCKGFSDLQKGLQEGKFDLALTYDFDVDLANNVEIAYLEELENYLVCSRELPIPDKEEYCFRDFEGFDFIVNTPEDTPGGFSQFMEKIRKANMTPNFKFAKTANQYMLLIEAGFGVSVLSRRSNLYLKRNVKFLKCKELDANHMILEWDKANENPRVKHAVKMIRELFENK